MYIVWGWCRWWDLNPHGFPFDFESNASAVPPHRHNIKSISDKFYVKIVINKTILPQYYSFFNMYMKILVKKVMVYIL